MPDQTRQTPVEISSSRKSKRSKKAAQQPAARADVMEAAGAAREDNVAPAEVVASEATHTPDVTPAAIETEQVAANLPAVVVSTAPLPVGLQTIASAYRDYTQKSFAEATSFVERLAAARSFEKAVEVQTEFARQACETFAADSRKIRGLYQEMFWQALSLPTWPPRQSQR